MISVRRRLKSKRRLFSVLWRCIQRNRIEVDFLEEDVFGR
jgi:hypothetical protein